jgi:exopolyphosphatase/guanosine-5'-triphosphate,3'-diphosphate pyrophosphatase
MVKIQTMTYGAIDIGTNAARLLVGEVVKQNGHSFVKKISYTRIPLRLGLDVFESGEISERKLAEFSKTIKAFKLISEVFHVEKIRACATSAMREANNGEMVKNHIFNETGIEIEIIGGEDEAQLIFSAFFLLDFDKSMPFVVIDVGGGSTEISVFESGQKTSSKSFQLGTIRLLKKKEKQNVWSEVRTWIEENVDTSKIHKVFATGGNINKLHKMLGLRFMEPLKYRDLDEIYGKLKDLTIEQRVEKFQLKEDRADVIVPACEIFKTLMEDLKVKELIIPRIGLSDGIIYDLYKQQHVD